MSNIDKQFIVDEFTMAMERAGFLSPRQLSEGCKNGQFKSIDTESGLTISFHNEVDGVLQLLVLGFGYLVYDLSEDPHFSAADLRKPSHKTVSEEELVLN